MQQLIEDYERRIATINDTLHNTVMIPPMSESTIARLTTKRAGYRHVISELRREYPNTLLEFIEWARDCGEDAFYIFDHTEEAIEKFIIHRTGSSGK